ncbi:hypothetical protein ACQ4PT_006689 [Festuca glaucescens]
MVAGCVITEEYAVAVSADRMWKVACSGDALLKACAGLIDSVDVEGDGGPGSITTMTLSAAGAAASGGRLMRRRVVARDDEAQVLRNEVLEGSKVNEQLRSLVTELKIEAAGEGGCVAKFKLEYERLDGGGALVPKNQAALTGGYLCLLKTIEAYLVANPADYA